MKSPLLKIGAVVSALVLGGIYVVVQQQKGKTAGDSPPSAEEATADDVTLMIGSKSAGGEFEVPLVFEQADAEEPPPVLMPSSKVIISPVFLEIDKDETPAPADLQPLMTSSKSGAVQIDPEKLKSILQDLEALDESRLASDAPGNDESPKTEPHEAPSESQP